MKTILKFLVDMYEVLVKRQLFLFNFTNQTHLLYFDKACQKKTLEKIKTKHLLLNRTRITNWRILSIQIHATNLKIEQTRSFGFRENQLSPCLY